MTAKKENLIRGFMEHEESEPLAEELFILRVLIKNNLMSYDEFKSGVKILMRKMAEQVAETIGQSYETAETTFETFCETYLKTGSLELLPPQVNALDKTPGETL